MENEIANWETLPNELRMHIIRFMHKKTRSSFRKCSKSCKDLVDRTKLRTLNKVKLECSKSWSFFDGTMRHIEQLSFDKAQKAINEAFKSVDDVDRFIVEMRVKDMTESFRFPCGQMNVRNLQFKAREINEKLGYNLDINTLKQFCPLYLSSISLNFENRGGRVCPEVYDLPQVCLPERVTIVEYSSIRDDQLLNLNATKLAIGDAGCITGKGLVKYLEKCLTELNTKAFDIMVQFETPKEDCALVEGLSRVFFAKKNKSPSDDLFSSSVTRSTCPAERDEYYTVLNSPYPEHKLEVYEVRFNENDIVVLANRIRPKAKYSNDNFE